MEQSKPLISIGMIVKNEIRCIERCLKALEPLRKAVPCELVIADTGSDDGTREVIERYADLTFDFPWVNDFSAARNAVMDRCSGTWYFSIDADEYLDADISQFIQFFQKPTDAAYGMVIVRNYNTLAMKTGESSDFNALRLVKMELGTRYVGTIHEYLPLLSNKKTYFFNKIILHHDGYAVDLGARSEEKSNRNMELLRDALKKDPHNLRKLLQCVESTGQNQIEQGEYIRQGMQEMMRKGADLTNPFAAPLWRYAIKWATTNHMPELDEWLEWGEGYFSESIYYCVDVSFFLNAYYYNQEEYEKAILWGEKYWNGYTQYQAGHYDFRSEIYSSLQCVQTSLAYQGLISFADSLQKCHQGQHALTILAALKPESLGADTIQKVLFILRELYHQPELSEKAAELCTIMTESVLHTELCSDEAAKRRAVWLTVAAQFFGDGDWSLFLSVSGDIGISAQVMGETDKAKLQNLLAKINQWREVPNPVILHVIEVGVALPDGFYSKDIHSLRNTAVALGARPNLPTILLSWKENALPDSMVKLQFLFELTAATLRSMDWKVVCNKKQLCEFFIDLSERYIKRLYHSELLKNKKDWDVLPGLHQYVLYILYARDAGLNGDELLNVHYLQEALRAAPAMKEMVHYLLEAVKESRRKNASPELLRLAEKVCSILNQYSSDDPAVVALKQSEAYQKVAYLIEGMESPAFGGILQ